MAKSEYVTLRGKFSWVRHDRPDPQYNKYKFTLHPDAESLDKIRELKERGLKNELKKDEDGYYMTFSRDVQKTYNGVTKGLGPIELVDGNTRLPDGTYAPLRNTMVGNGSDGACKLEVFGFKRFPGIAARAVSIRVDNLVPFSGKSDLNDLEERAQRDFDKVPAEPQW